jgi:hypothetical protein
MTQIARIAILGLSFLLSACAGVRVHDRASGRPVALTLCQQGETVQQRSTLYFGAARPDGGVVSDQEWQDFLAQTVTPAFPDGLTWFAARGQWRGGDATIVREDSRLIVLLHDGDVRTQQRLDRIAERYKRAFAQESVLQERVAVCVRFH